jgi:hypothetical protein
MAQQQAVSSLTEMRKFVKEVERKEDFDSS